MFVDDAAQHRIEIEIRVGMLYGDGLQHGAVFFRKPEAPLDAHGQPLPAAFVDECLQQAPVDAKFTFHAPIINC